MATERIVNNGQTTLAVALGAAALQMTVTDASLLPALSGGDEYHVVVYDPSAPANAEVMLVTAATGNILAVTRAREAIAGVQTAFDHAAGETVAAVLTVESLTSIITQLSLSQAEADALYQPLDAQLTSLAGLSYTGNAAKVVAVTAGEDGFELTAAEVGDVVGPAGASDTAVARYDGITGKLLKDSSLLVTDAGKATLTLIDGVTDGTSLLLDLRHGTSGTAANGFGSTLQVLGETDGGGLNEQLWVNLTWVDATTATRKARIVHTAFDTSGRECLRLEASGTAPMIGFLGANASARLVSPDLGTLATTFGFASGTPTFAYGNLTGAPTLGTASALASDTDGTLAANSDARIATQKAVKTYVDTAVTGLWDFKGSTDASANPNYPAALKGDAYVISVAGKIGGASGKNVDAGDVYLATADNAGGTEAAVGTSWTVLEHNLEGALLAGNNLSDLTDDAAALTNLGGTTTGQALFTLANPGAITFLRINADNTVTALSDSAFRTAIGAGTSSFSGAFADLSSKPTTLAGYGITDAQPLDATLTALAGLTIAANSLTIGTGADAFSQTTFAANTFPARASTGALEAKSITDFALTLLDDADPATARATLGAAGLNYASPSGMRLTLTSGTAVTTSDVTAAGTIYLAVHKADYLLVPNSGATDFEAKTPGELSLALTLTSGKNYDVFCWNNGGTLTLALSSAWTNDTTRADALGVLKGIKVNNATIGSMGAKTGIWLGTLRASGANTTEDSLLKRFLWNMYHRVPRPMRVLEGTDLWTYNSTTWRQVNAASANKLEFVRGLNEDAVAARGMMTCDVEQGDQYTHAIGLDWTSGAPAAGGLFGIAAANAPATANIRDTPGCSWNDFPGLGYHTLVWVEKVPSGAVTIYGDAGVDYCQSGISCEVMA